MPRFVVEDGRALPVARARARSGPSASVLAEVRASVLDLVDSPLLPLAWRGDDPLIGDYLVALDATGAAAVVVVADVLDSQFLVAAMARSSTVRRSSWRDVSLLYPAGPDQLRLDWAAFRESLPPRGEPAPALVVLAGQVDDQVRSAVDLMDGAMVTVHEVTELPHNGRLELAIEPITARVVARHEALEAHDGAGSPEWAGVALTGVGQASSAGSSPTGAPAPANTEAAATGVAASPNGGESAARDGEPTPVRRSRVRAHGPDESERAALLAAVVDLVGEAELVLDGSGGAVRALLITGGVLVTGGTAFSDPGEAASAVTGTKVADGWAAWRFGESGPYLGEAVEEALSPAQTAGRGRRAAR